MPIIFRLAVTPIDDPRHIRLSDSLLNSLNDEAYKFSKQWQRQGYIKYTSSSRYSFIYDEILANRAFARLYRYIKSFKHYAADHDVKRIYGYEVMVNPKNLHYSQTLTLNRAIIRYLKSNSNIQIIQKAIEDTYYHAGINVHIHYLIVSTRPLNCTKIKRRAKKYGRDATNSVTKVSVSKVDDWRHASSYVTKQYGLPLPLKNHQFKYFIRLPLTKKMKLLSSDINGSKGIIKHYFYVSGSLAKSWYQPIKIRKRQVKLHKKAKRYCKKHNLLVVDLNNAKNAVDNCSLTVFGCPFGKLYCNAHKPTSKHHYSQHEQLMQLYHHNIYYHCSNHAKQTSLF